MALKRLSEKKNATGRSMTAFHVVYFFLSLLALGAIIHIQYFWKPDEKTKGYFTLTATERVIHPERGSILARDGRPMAIAFPNYHITMDCAIQRDEFNKKRSDKSFRYNFRKGKKDSVVYLTGQEMERLWRSNAKAMCEGIERILGGKSADQLYKEILAERAAGRHSLSIARFIDHETMLAIKELPLAREGRNQSGLIIEEE